MSYTLPEMVDLVGLEVYDEKGERFPHNLVTVWLNRAQDHILSMVNAQYVVSLHTVDADKSATSGTFALSGLTYTVYRKHLGLMGVKSADTGGIYCDPIDFEQYRQLINDGHTFATTNPAYMVRGSTLYVFPTTIAKLDIYYMREPKNMVYNIASGSIVAGTVYTVTEYPYINGTTYTVTYNGTAEYDGHTFTGAAGVTTYTTSGVGTVSIPCELEDDLQDAIIEYAMHFGHELNGDAQKADRKIANAYGMVQVINNKIDPEHVAVRPIERTASVAYRADRVTNVGGR